MAVKTEGEIQDWLAQNMPDGPGDDPRQQGIQDALDWVTFLIPVLEAD